MIKRIVLIVSLLVALAGPLYAAATPGSWTDFTFDSYFNGNMIVMKATFTAGDAAAIPTKTPSTTEFNRIKGYYLCYVGHMPGTTGPTNGAWDITLVGATTARLDISGTAASNLSSTVGQTYWVKDTGGTPGCQPILENFGIVITGNAVNSAVATVYLIFVKP
jgi:hypothetical protein